MVVDRLVPMFAVGREPAFLFRAKLRHMEGRLSPLYANGEARERRFWRAKAACKDFRRGSNLYLSAIHRKSPVDENLRGFFVSG